MLARPLSLTLVALALAPAYAASLNKASLTVPAAAILPSANGPDDAGGFDLTVKLQGLPVKAAHCGSQLGLLVQMGDTIPKDVTADLDAAQKAQAVRKTAYYKSIMAARDAGHPVTLHLVGSPKYLLQENGRIEAPYCAVSLDETALAP